MTRQTEWTQEERERAAAVLNSDARTVKNTNVAREDTVTPETCEYWRTRIRDFGELPERVDGKGFAEATIRKHACGRCNHESVGAPVKYDGVRWVTQEEGE